MDEDTVKHVLRFGWACYLRKHRNDKWTDEDWLRFTTCDEFWQWVTGKTRLKTKLYLFCHNTSFDLPVLDVFGSLPRYGFNLRSAIIDAPPTILRFRNGTKSIVVLDTLNIWRMPLKYLGEEIGLPKLEMPDNNDLALEFDTYAKRDVEIIKAACLHWFDFLATNDYGSFAYTLASQSMRMYRHKYMKHPIFIDDDPKALKLTRTGYYGGRVECFYIGRFEGVFYSLDVNSMYPFVMSHNPYPCKLVAYTRYASIEDLHIWLRSYSLSLHARIRTSIPFAAVKLEGKLMFPVGEFDAYLSTPEIQYCLEYAAIVTIHEVAVYEQADLFSEMLIEQTNIKAQAKRDGDLVKEFMTKKLVNSFYGKWGQSGGKWIEDYFIEDLSAKRWLELDMETGRKIFHRQLGGLVQVRDDEGESRDSFPAIAAHVTAYARMHLWKLIVLAGPGNTYYCDTDCVVVNVDGRDRLKSQMDKYKLGALKQVDEYDVITILGNKDYRFGSKSKTKGVRKNAVWLDDNKVQQDQWSSLKGLISKGDVTAPTTKKITKQLSRKYDKGIVTSSGKVEPHVLK